MAAQERPTSLRQREGSAVPVTRHWARMHGSTSGPADCASERAVHRSRHDMVLVCLIRWANADGSIFSVADGARLAQEPVKVPSAWEAARLNR